MESGDLLEHTDVHVHFPAGAVSKDGPSAGVTITTVLVSLFTGKCVRPDTAMTGEITLRGIVLPVSIITQGTTTLTLVYSEPRIRVITYSLASESTLTHFNLTISI